jgi:methenyltetrahydrofolate cyclohydrolase
MASAVERSLTGFLDDVAAETPAPGGGSVSAVTVGLAAALAAMAARFSRRRMDDADALAAEADALRERVLPLAQADAESYSAVLAAYRLPTDEAGRDAAIVQALSKAADVPLAIAEIAAEVGELAARIADSGNPNLLGDAAAATYLAQAAALASANLVRINLHDDSDERVARAQAAVDRVGRSTRPV